MTLESALRPEALAAAAPAVEAAARPLWLTALHILAEGAICAAFSSIGMSLLVLMT